MFGEGIEMLPWPRRRDVRVSRREVIPEPLSDIAIDRFCRRLHDATLVEFCARFVLAAHVGDEPYRMHSEPWTRRESRVHSNRGHGPRNQSPVIATHKSVRRRRIEDPLLGAAPALAS